MSVHRYAVTAVRADYVRAIGGFLLTGGLAVLARGATVATASMTFCALLFLVFGVRTRIRQKTVIEILDDGISISAERCVTLPWRELSALRLRYYATKRDRTGGWMQLTLAAGRKRVSVESSLDGFVNVARRAAAAARANDLQLDAATLNNLVALGDLPASRAA
jgi:hypothetical protein